MDGWMEFELKIAMVYEEHNSNDGNTDYFSIAAHRVKIYSLYIASIIILLLQLWHCSCYIWSW